MVVRIKEVVLRYEDDGEESPLTATEHKEKYRPLQLSIHHHCSPPKILKEGDITKENGEITVDVSK